MDEIMEETVEQTREEEPEHPAGEETEWEAVTEQDVPEEREEETAEGPLPPRSDAGEDGEGDLLRQARALVEAFPELRGKEAPDEVIRAAMQGENLTAAYARYALARSRADNARLERELSARQQNAEAAARAPVRGVSGGAAVKEQGRDPFLAGFLED